MLYTAHSRTRTFPTAVDPVNDSFRINSEWLKANPTAATSDLSTVMTFMTPAGKPIMIYCRLNIQYNIKLPAASAIEQRASADRGVSSEGFITTVHPAARAAPVMKLIRKNAAEVKHD